MQNLIERLNALWEKFSGNSLISSWIKDKRTVLQKAIDQGNEDAKRLWKWIYTKEKPVYKFVVKKTEYTPDDKQFEKDQIKSESNLMRKVQDWMRDNYQQPLGGNKIYNRPN